MRGSGVEGERIEMDGVRKVEGTREPREGQR